MTTTHRLADDLYLDVAVVGPMSNNAYLLRDATGRGILVDAADDPEALTELRINGVFTLSAPVLQEEDNFYTLEDLFSGDNLRDLAGILKG